MPKLNLKNVVDSRFADVAPQSYSHKDRCVDAVLSMGSPVKRFYGTEVLKIDAKSVILDRAKSSGIPILDSHSQASINNALGRISDTWFKNGALMGRIKFNDTEEGRKAEGMVARGEIAGISAGYRVDEWQITDKDGEVIDPERDRVRWDDDLTFTATRWELLEASLVAVPADGAAMIRSFGSGVDRVTPEVDAMARNAVRITKRFGDLSVTYEYPSAKREESALADTLARMRARQRMLLRE